MNNKKPEINKTLNCRFHRLLLTHYVVALCTQQNTHMMCPISNTTTEEKAKTILIDDIPYALITSLC